MMGAAVAQAGRAAAQVAASPNDRLGVAMIGCGGRGKHLLGEVAALRDAGALIDIVAVCDTYKPRMEALASKYGVPGYMDHRELLANADVDVVGIATPDHIHGYQVIDAVRAGKDAYCEKPFTHWRQFELTKKVVEEVEKSGRVVQIGTQGMSDTAWSQIRALIDSGLVGQPIHAECGYFRVGDWGERGMPIDDPNVKPGPDLNWEAFLGDAPKRDFDVSRYFRWRMYEDYSGGPVTDLFPHSLTPVVHMLGVGMPAAAVALGGKFRYEEREVPDTFNMLIDYPEHITVAVLGTQGNNYSGPGKARGAGGRIPVIRGWEGTITLEENEIVFIPAEGSNKSPQRMPVENPESIKKHWEDLFDCVRNRQQPKSNVQLGLKVQTALQMAALALRNETMVKFNATTQSIEIGT